ncbi:MAG: Holliday junction resolvase RuvX [Armatimonadota bacterium]
MRIIGLDVGEKTIGVAMSDELGIAANPVTIIKRTDSIRLDISAVRQIAEANDVKLAVVGLPLMMDGSKGIQVEKTLLFVSELKRRTRLEVVTWDERLSTAEVERIMIANDQSRAKRKKVIDKLSATVILQGYMDRHRTPGYIDNESIDEE